MAIVAPELGRHSWPVMATHDALSARLGELLGGALIDVIEHAGETTAVVQREALVPAITALCDAADLKFNQLTDICGADYPDRAERFEIVIHLLSMTHNLRLRVKLSTDGRAPVAITRESQPLRALCKASVALRSRRRTSSRPCCSASARAGGSNEPGRRIARTARPRCRA